MCEFEMGFKKFFVGVLVSAIHWYMFRFVSTFRSENGCGNYIFGLKQGQCLETRAVHPHQEFPGVPLDLKDQL